MGNLALFRRPLISDWILQPSHYNNICLFLIDVLLQALFASSITSVKLLKHVKSI